MKLLIVSVALIAVGVVVFIALRKRMTAKVSR